jgi:predicted RNase H-like HicB family nuclease
MSTKKPRLSRSKALERIERAITSYLSVLEEYGIKIKDFPEKKPILEGAYMSALKEYYEIYDC